MRLLHVTPHYYPAWAFGGTARVAYELTHGLAARGHAVTVFTTDALDAQRRIDMGGAPGPVDVEGVRVYYFRNAIHALSARLNLSTPRGMRRAAREMAGSFDIVHCHELRTVENVLTTPAVRAPLVLSPHGTLPYGTGRGTLKRVWDWLIGGALAARFDAVAALTGAEVGQFRRLRHRLGLLPRWVHVEVIPNGVHLEDFAGEVPAGAFRARWGVPAEALLVLFLGRLHPRKGVDVLIEALRSVPEVWLLVAGPDAGARAEWEALAARLGVADRVIFAGFLDGDDKRAALAAADAFALPARGEGLPVAALEAGAAGLPLLLSRECYLPEVEEAGAGRVLPLEAEAWAGTFRTLCDRERRADMGRAARRLVKARFTWPVVLDRVEAFYESIVAAR